MGMTSGASKGLQADINVTPLIDVLLVLLIIFMVIQPITLRGLDARVPQQPKSANQAISNPQTIVVQVLGNGEHGVTYKINETPLNKTEIEAKLADIFAIRAEKTMFIKGDGNLDFSLIADVIDYGHQAGVDNIGLITPQTEYIRKN